VQGDADEVIDPQQVIQWSQQVPAQPQLVVLPGVGHFFHGKLDLLQEQVLAFARN
jgi:alpha/beta superfamily hydrolase